jgi:hypothetical protein
MYSICPVHDGTSLPETIFLTRDDYVAIAGSPEAVSAAFAQMGTDPTGVDFFVAWPELPPYHQRQFVVIPARFQGDMPDFTDFGTGAFLIPAGSRIDISPAGILCVYRPDPERHTRISSAPLAELN